MKKILWIYSPIGLMLLIGLIGYQFKQPSDLRALGTEPPIQEVLGWDTQYATYVRNTANWDYDPELRVVTLITIDRDERTISHDERATISNLSEVVAGLPNVAPLAIFEGQNLVCTLDQELTYESAGMFVFRCEYPAQ